MEKKELGCLPVYAKGAPGSTFESEPEFYHGTFQGGHSVNVYGDNEDKLVVFGGYNGNERTKDLYLLNGLNLVGNEEDSSTTQLQWEKHELQNTQDRAGHISWIRQDKLYVYGGYNSEHQVLSDVAEIELPSNNNSNPFQVRNVEYKTKSQDLDRRWHCGSYLSHLDKVVVHGGWNDRGPLGDMIVYDCNANTWETLKFSGDHKPIKMSKSKAPSPRRWHTFTPIKSETFFVFGGYTSESKNTSSILGDQYIFDLNIKTWLSLTTKGEKPANRCRHTVSKIGDKQLILIGGYSGDKGEEGHKEIYTLTLDDMKWTKLTGSASKQLFPIVRSGHRAVEVKDKGIIISGGLFLPDYIDDFYLLDTRKC